MRVHVLRSREWFTPETRGVEVVGVSDFGVEQVEELKDQTGLIRQPIVDFPIDEHRGGTRLDARVSTSARFLSTGFQGRLWVIPPSLVGRV